MKKGLQISDWARLAAFIDGEGCIGVYKRESGPYGPRYRLQVQVANTDPKLMFWLMENFGGRVKPSNRLRREWKMKYDWIVAGPLALQILVECMPYFLLKSEQAVLAISFQSMERKNHGRKGMPVAQRSASAFCSRKIHEMKLRNQVVSEVIQ